jgi:hypothetical protein
MMRVDHSGISAMVLEFEFEFEAVTSSISSSISSSSLFLRIDGEDADIEGR